MMLVFGGRRGEWMLVVELICGDNVGRWYWQGEWEIYKRIWGTRGSLSKKETWWCSDWE